MNNKAYFKALFNITFALCSAIGTSTALADQAPIPVSKTIPGWPNYLAMGTVTNNAPSVGDALTQIPLDAIFKYAGEDGGGDPGKVTDTSTIEKTIKQARYIEDHSVDHHKVMPVLIVYTINGSGGIYTAADDVLKDDYLTKHYINLIQYCAYMESQRDAKHAYPATIILNPDFMGVVQQTRTQSPPLTPDTKVNVMATLNSALAQSKIPGPAPKPPVFANDLRGYIQSINWIVRTLGPHIPFGWQENVWATGSANWLHVTPFDQVSTISAPVTNYILNDLQAYSGNYKPDFLVFDRYERDDFFVNPTIWLYRESDWKNYLAFVSQVSRPLGVPAVIWQIPGGHILTKDDRSKLTLDHVATAPDFFFGDPSLGQNFPQNIQPQVMNFPLVADAYGKAAATSGEYLAREGQQNWSQPKLETTVLNNIVAILWGGGGTTSVVPLGTNGDDGGWLANKIKLYYQSPVKILAHN